MATKTINTILNLKDQFSSKFVKVGKQTKQQSKQMKLLDNHVKGFKKSATQSFGAVAKSAGTLAVAFVGINSAVEGVRNGVQFVKDYQASLTDLQAATGATAAETEVMKNQINDLYKQNMGESWSDLANSMTLVKQITGQTGEELKNTTAMAVTYRDVFGEDIAGSIKSVDSMMKNFGISSEQAFNLLSQGAQNGLNKTGDLLDTAWEYSAYFSQLGFEADEMFNIFSAGMENGAFSLDKVGDAMKEFGVRVKDESKSTSTALSGLGFNANDMMQQFAKGGDAAQSAFTQVMQSLSAIDDPVKKNTIGVALFGTMFEDLESGVIESLGSTRDQFDMTKSTMDEINKIKYNDATQAFQGIGRLVETSVLVPIADKLLPKLSEFGQWFSNNTPQIEAAITTAFAKGALVVDGFGQALGWAKDNADWLIPVIAGLTTAIAAQKVISTVSGLYKTWTTVTKGMTVAQIALNLATKASPFGWIATIIGLVIGLGVLLWKNWDKVKEKAAALGNGIKKVWGGISKWTSKTFTNMKNKAGSTFDHLKTSVMDKMQKTENWLSSFPLGQSVLTIIKDMVSNVKTIFGGITKFVKSVFKGDWKGAWQGITQIFKGVFGSWKTYAKAPLQLIVGMFNTMPGKVGNAIDKVKDYFVNKITGVRDWLSSFPLGQGILVTLEGMYTNVKDIFGGIITFVTSIFKGDWESAWDGIVQSFSGVFGLITTYAKAPLNALIGLVNTVIDQVNGLSVDIPDWVPKYGGETFGFNIPKIPQFGLGTSYFTGGLAQINERNGGEIVNLPNGSQVIPADKSQQLINNSKGDTKIEIHIHGNVIGDEDEVNRLMTKVTAKLSLALGNG